MSRDFMVEDLAYNTYHCVKLDPQFEIAMRKICVKFSTSTIYSILKTIESFSDIFFFVNKFCVCLIAGHSTQFLCDSEVSGLMLLSFGVCVGMVVSNRLPKKPLALKNHNIRTTVIPQSW